MAGLKQHHTILLVALLLIISAILTYIAHNHNLATKDAKLEEKFLVENPYNKPPRALAKDTITELTEGVYRNYVIDRETLQQKIASQETFMLYIFKPNCEECSRMEHRILEELAYSGLNYAQLNQIEDKDIMRERGYVHVPVLQLFINGVSVMDSQGLLSEEETYDWLQQAFNVHHELTVGAEMETDFEQEIGSETK